MLNNFNKNIFFKKIMADTRLYLQVIELLGEKNLKFQLLFFGFSRKAKKSFFWRLPLHRIQKVENCGNNRQKRGTKREQLAHYPKSPLHPCFIILALLILEKQ